jgi:hypothetical protein
MVGRRFVVCHIAILAGLRINEFLAIGSLIDAKSIPRLAQMYRLFADVDGLKILCAAFKAHIQVCQ